MSDGVLSRRAFMTALVGVALANKPAVASVDGARVLRLVGAQGLIGHDALSPSHLIANLEIGEALLGVGSGGRLEPALAVSAEASNDDLTWRFRLRPRATFHDGAPVTSAVVVAALQRLRGLPAAALRRAPIADVRAEDDEVVIALSKPFALLPAFLATAQSTILAPSSYAPDGSLRTILGSGAFRVVSARDLNTLEIEAADPGAVGPGSVRAVRFSAVPDSETRARMLEAGDADIAYTVSPVAADRLARNPDVAVKRTPGPRIRIILMNLDDPRLGDVRVRRALSLAIDRTGVSRAILRSPGSAATQMMPPVLPDWTLPGPPRLIYDAAEAERLLDDAGWRRGEDGVRAKDGARLSFSLCTYAMRPELAPVAQALQGGWRKIGVEVAIEMATPERLLARAQNRSLELALASRSYFVVPECAGTLSEDFRSDSPSLGWGSVGWRSDEIDDAFGAYEASRDEGVRARSRETILRVLHDELPVIPHSWYEFILAHSSRVANVVIDPFETSYRVSRMRWAA